MLGGLTVMAGGWSAALPGGGRSSTLRPTMTATTDRTVDLCEDVMSISFPPTADQFRVTGCFPALSVTAAHRYQRDSKHSFYSLRGRLKPRKPVTDVFVLLPVRRTRGALGLAVSRARRIHRCGAAAAFGRDNRFPPTCAQSSCLSHMA